VDRCSALGQERSPQARSKILAGRQLPSPKSNLKKAKIMTVFVRATIFSRFLCWARPERQHGRTLRQRYTSILSLFLDAMFVPFAKSDAQQISLFANSVRESRISLNLKSRSQSANSLRKCQPVIFRSTKCLFNMVMKHRATRVIQNEKMFVKKVPVGCVRV